MVISRRELQPPEYFACRRDEVIAWAKWFGVEPTDLAIQMFLLQGANAPWIPENKTQTLAQAAVSLTDSSQNIAKQHKAWPFPLDRAFDPANDYSRWLFSLAAFANDIQFYQHLFGK